MHCNWTKDRLTAYENGDLRGLARVAVLLHLRLCGDCFRRYESLASVSSPLRALDAPEPPRSLNTQIRAALSLELARGNRWQWQLAQLRAALRESLRPVAIRALGGALSALILFGAVMPDLWRNRVLASDDVPVTYLAQRLVSSPTLHEPGPYAMPPNTTVLVYVDTRGGAYKFDLPDEQNHDRKLRAEIARALLFAEFEPATVFGRPVAGQILLTFTTCNVKG